MTSSDDRDSGNAISPAERRRSAASVFGLFVLPAIFGAVVGVCCVHWLHPKGPPVYEASTIILAMKRQTSAAPPSDTGVTADPISHGYLIRSPVVVQMAVEKFKLEDLDSFKEVAREDIAKTIILNLTAGKVVGPDASHDSDVIEVRFRSAGGPDAIVVVKALTAAHSDFLKQAYQPIDNDFIQLMSQAKDSLSSELKMKHDELLKFVKDAPVGVAANPTEPGRVEESLRRATEAREKLELRRTHLKAVVAAAPAAESPINDSASIRAVELLLAPYVESSDDAKNSSPAEALLALVAEKERLSAELRKDHVKTKEAELKIAVAKELLNSGTGSRGAKEADQSKETAKEFVAAAIKKIRMDLSIVEQEIADLTQQMARTEKEVQYEEGFRREYTALQADITKTKELHQLVLDRLKQINLMGDSGGYSTTVISAPDAAVLVEPNRVPLMIAAAAIGAVAGCALAALLLVLRVA